MYRPYSMMAKVYDQIKNMNVGDSIIADKNYYPDGTEQTWEKYRMCLNKISKTINSTYWTRLDGDSLTIHRLG